MALQAVALYFQAVGVIGLAVVSAFVANMTQLHGLCIFLVFCFVWLLCTASMMSAHGFRVLVRTWGSDKVSIREGSFAVWFPEYVVSDRAQFGPWSERGQLPKVGQMLEIDVPEVLVPVENGLYCLKVNTKVVGTVRNYSVEDLTQNPISINRRCHDVIAHALRRAVYDKSVEDALADIQHMFLKDANSISDLIKVPAFQPTQLLLDADQRVAAADQATTTALDLLVQRKQEAAKRSALEASMETEEQKVKLHKVSLQVSKNNGMMQQEIYGKEGAALIEASKHAKALYLFSGSSGLSSSSVLSLPN